MKPRTILALFCALSFAVPLRAAEDEVLELTVTGGERDTEGAKSKGYFVKPTVFD